MSNEDAGFTPAPRGGGGSRGVLPGRHPPEFLMDDLQQDADVQAAPRAYTFIQLAVALGVARITLNRPPANVLSVEVLSELNHALDSLEYQREVKVVVLAATGKYFSAGLEIQDHLGD